ncbi:MAG: glycosyltransferase [Fusobacteriaceae bacterium]
MKKIGFCIDSLEMGGAEKLLVDIIKMLHETRRYEVHLITKNESDSNFYHEIKDKVTYSYLISKEDQIRNKKIGALGKIKSSIQKKKSFKNFITDLDLIIDFLDCDFYKFIKKLNKIKNIAWLHGNYKELQYKKKIDNKMKYYDDIIVTTEDMYKILKNLSNKVFMIYNLIDFEKIAAKMNGEILISEKKLFQKEYFLTVCRLNENEKDVKTLLKAFSEYKGNELLYIVGDGPSREELEKVTADLNIEERVLFLGKKYNPFIYMKNAKAFILSTKFEGFGLVVAEALYCGTKVISSDCDFGPREILLNGEIGELFKVGDTKDLLEKMNTIEEKIYSKEKITQSLKRFTKEEILEKIEGVINV